MKYDYENDADIYTFESTGRKIYANHLIVGISPNMSISEGYDGELDHEEFTPEERLELAWLMVRLWVRYASGEEPQP